VCIIWDAVNAYTVLNTLSDYCATGVSMLADTTAPIFCLLALLHLTAPTYATASRAPIKLLDPPSTGYRFLALLNHDFTE